MKLRSTNKLPFTGHNTLTPHSESKMDFVAYVTLHVQYIQSLVHVLSVLKSFKLIRCGWCVSIKVWLDMKGPAFSPQSGYKACSYSPWAVITLSRNLTSLDNHSSLTFRRIYPPFAYKGLSHTFITTGLIIFLSSLPIFRPRSWNLL